MARAPIFRTERLETNRVEAFSDGVIAVAITLLVLDVKLPEGLDDNAAIWAALQHNVPVLGAWVVSFAFVLTIWINHHDFFSSLKGVDRGLMWLNGLFLLFVTLIPFPTKLVGQYPGQSAPLAMLGLVMTACSAAFALMRIYATFQGRLMRDQIDRRQARAAVWRSLAAPVLYGGAAALAFVWTPGAIAMQVAVLSLFIVRSPGHLIVDGRTGEA